MGPAYPTLSGAWPSGAARDLTAVSTEAGTEAEGGGSGPDRDNPEAPTRKWSRMELGQGPHKCQRVLLGCLRERDVDRQRLKEAQICSVCSLRDEMPSELN